MEKRLEWMFYITISIFILIGCSEEKKASSNKNDFQKDSNVVTSEGHKLALSYCQGCHLFPEPSLLDTSSWQRVLTHMGYRLGIKIEEGYSKMNPLDKQLLRMQAIFPENELLSIEDYEKLKDYYLDNAPAQLVLDSLSDKSLLSSEPLELFEPSFPISEPAKNPLTTLVEFVDDTTLAIGDYDNKVNLYRNNFNTLQQEIFTSSAPVSMVAADNHYYLLCVGNIFPNDLGTGHLVKLNKQATNTRLGKVISENLVRPVHLGFGDLSSSKSEDLVVSNFGYFTGNLSVFEQASKDYKQQKINNEPGNNKVLITDVDKDGLNDILTLRAQGNEGIFAYLNKGEGLFEEKPILRFPPVYGSSYFEWIDINNDGLEDIIYCNGDNADYSPILKPYHGVRLFLNQGNLTFKERLFLPMYGASQSVTHDFDQDGDLDIASIAFFPDFDHAPDNGFIYFEQTENLVFKRHTTRLASNGRWLTMDKGDLDQDGDMDLVLGNFTYSQIPVADTLKKKWTSKGYKIMYLENQL